MLAVMQEPTGADSLDNLVSFRDEPSPEPFSAEGHYFDPYSQTERLKKTDLDSISNYALALLRQRREITGAEFDYARSQEMQTAPDTGLPKNANETGRLAIDVGREETIDLKLKLYCATGDSEKSFRFDQAMTEFVNRHLAGKGIRMPEIMGYKKVEVDGREYVCSLKKHIKTHSLADQDLKTHMNDFIMAADAVYDFGKSGIRNLKELRQAGVRVTKRGMEVNAKRYLKHMNVSASKQETADFIAAYREFSAGLRTEINRNGVLGTGDSRYHNLIVEDGETHFIDIEDRNPLSGKRMQVTTAYHEMAMLYMSAAIDSKRNASKKELAELEDRLVGNYMKRTGEDEGRAREYMDKAKVDIAMEKIIDNLEKYSTDPKGREGTALRALDQLTTSMDTRIRHAKGGERARLRNMKSMIYNQIMKSDYQQLKNYIQERSAYGPDSSMSYLRRLGTHAYDTPTSYSGGMPALSYSSMPSYGLANRRALCTGCYAN